MMLYEIPPRMQTKKGIFGTSSTMDIVIFIGTCVTSMIVFMAFKSMPVFIVCLLAMGFSWIFFIQPFKYDDNLRTWMQRMMKFNKSQRIYYYYRGTK